MAMTVLLTILSLLTCGVLVASEDYGFVYPNATNPSDENLVFLLGQEITIEWNSPYAAIKLAFIAEDGPLFQFFSQNNTGNNFDWAVNVNNSGSSSPYYYLYFENEDDNTQHYYSALFRVDAAVDAAKTLPTAAATDTITPSPSLQASQTTLAGGTTVFVTQAITQSATIASSASTTAATASSSASGTSTDLSTDAKIGIGVGVPLGVLALIGAACLIIWAAKRSSRAGRIHQGEPGVFTGVSNLGGNGYVSPNIPVAGAAPYDQQSPYRQQGVEMAKFGPGTRPYAYAPVQQQPINQGVGMHELPTTTTEFSPQELDTTNEGYDGYRTYR